MRGESKPRRCRFFVKNSETEISRCLAAISPAVERRRELVLAFLVEVFLLAELLAFFRDLAGVTVSSSAKRVGVAAVLRAKGLFVGAGAWCRARRWALPDP